MDPVAVVFGQYFCEICFEFFRSLLVADGWLSLRMFVNFGENLCERDVLALGEDGYFGQCAHFGVACGIHAFAVRQRLDDDAARRLCDVFVQTGLAGNGQNLFQFHNFFCSMYV